MVISRASRVRHCERSEAISFGAIPCCNDEIASGFALAMTHGRIVHPFVQDSVIGEACGWQARPGSASCPAVELKLYCRI